MIDVTRRGFLMFAPAFVPVVVEDRIRFGQTPSPELGVPSPDSTATSGQGSAAPVVFPRQDPAVAREMVIVSHGNAARVKELVGGRPALARAAWDWGYGDWETALGAASHIGNKEIAAVLLAAGAHPTIFSAAMLGQLDAVKAFIAASPGIQKTRGPHGITLLDHARNGKNVDVVRYLESIGDADPQYPNEALADADADAIIGAYAFGPSQTERLMVLRNSRAALVIKREGEFERNLFHHGGRVFNPSGAEAVRIRFEPASGPAATLVVRDGPLTVRGARVATGL